MHRLLIDATAISAGAKGVGRYAYHVVDQLSRRLDKAWTIYVLVDRNESPTFNGPNRPVVVNIKRYSEIVMGTVRLPLSIWTCRADVLLTSNEVIAWAPGVPRITILHGIDELIAEASEQSASVARRALDALKRRWRVFGLRRCRTIVCNSLYVAGEAAARYGIDRRALRIGYCGVDQRFYDGRDQVDAPKPFANDRWNGYVLAFATGDAYENSCLYPEIWRRVIGEVDRIGMVVAGVRQGSAYVTRLRRAFRDAGIIEGRDVTFVPFLGENEFDRLRALYREADFYLELSRHEGFGMQLAEAMATGTTCISSGCGALGEVGGRYAIRLDGLDPAAVAATIVESYRRRLHLRDNSEQVVFTRRYDWDSVGALLVRELSAIRRVAATHGRTEVSPVSGRSQAD